MPQIQRAIVSFTLIIAMLSSPLVFAQPDICEEIEDLIAQLDDDEWRVREAATRRLIEIGRSVLPKVEAALAGATAEQLTRLRHIIAILNQVTSPKVEWIGNGIGVYVFQFNIRPPIAEVCDLHFIVGTPEQSPGVDHSSSRITHNLPEGWKAQYNKETGEYQFFCDQTFGTPPSVLEISKDYKITIRTASMRKPSGKPGDMSWYWTNRKREKIGESGATQGPVW